MFSAHSFGALVRRQRKALDLTQAALAQQVGCAESLIRKIEAEERRPSRQVAERLADALRIVPEQRELFVLIARGERGVEQLVLRDQPLRWPETRPDAHLPSTLPTPLTPLVGREVELLALDTLLADPASRLVTIVAPGGMGKTRLAIAAAARQQSAGRFAHGIAFLDLAPIEHPNQVAASLAALFRLLPDNSGPAERSAETQLLNFLRTKRLLLVLDNAEHLLAAASLFTAILHSAPGVLLLVTSRERLHLQSEHLFPLGGLTIPADSRLAEHSDATHMFVQVARRANPTWSPAAGDLRAIAAICRLTGGMPLAIELAGAWAAMLSPAAILTELRRDLDLLSTTMRDVPERQRSVRAVFDATQRQLRPELQAKFARLAVFRAGFTYRAAAEVTGASLRDLADLTASAAISYDPASERYTLHELLRQYAAEHLAQDAAAELDALEAHASFFCNYVVEHITGLRSSGQRAAQAALEQDQENISAAWRRAIRCQRSDLIVTAAHGMGLFYELRADTLRGAAAFDDEVAALGEDSALEHELRARLLTWRSAFLRPLGQLHEAERLARRALELLDQAPQKSPRWQAVRAHAHIRLALALDDLRGVEARAEYELALHHYRALGRVWEESYVLYYIAKLCCDQDELEAAMTHGYASLELRQSCNDPRGIAHTLQLLSQISLARGELDEALALAQRCHTTFEELGDRAGVAKGLRQLGVAFYWHGRFEEALPPAEQSLAIYNELGLSAEIGKLHGLIGMVCAALRLSERGEEHARAAIGLHQQHPGALVDDYVALGCALIGQGRDEEAEQALRLSIALHKQLGRSTARAAPLLALCLALRSNHEEAQTLLAQTLGSASEQRVFPPLVMGLAVAALLLADMDDRANALEVAGLANSFPVIANNRGLLARLQPRRDAGPALFAAEIATAAGASGQHRTIWEVARRVAATLSDKMK